MTFSHIPVMANECINGLAIKPDGLYADCTAGGGGHSALIASHLTSGRLISIDRDPEAIAASEKHFAEAGVSDRISLVNDNFVNIASILDGRKIDGALIDLGVSSYQLDNPERGFSYLRNAPLDMRMNPDDTLSAYDVVNTYPPEKLEQIIYDYGEEKFARRIAQKIAEARSARPVETTLELAELIAASVPVKPSDGSNPAKRTFQALRIEVNGELEAIEPTLKTLIASLTAGGRLAVITFHSLEDRIVKNVFSALAKGCTCPPDFPVCVCGKKPTVKLVNKKPITASQDELKANPRSHSAKLRIAEKLPEGDEIR